MKKLGRIIRAHSLQGGVGDREKENLMNSQVVGGQPPPQQPGSNRLLAFLFASAQLVWACWMLASTVFKIGEYGINEFVQHYTNWSWTLQNLFYFATIGAPFLRFGVADVDGCFADATFFVIAMGFLPLHGVVWAVLVIVSVMLATEAKLFSDILEEVPATWVMLGDSIYHFWPVLVLLLFAIVYWKLIFVAYNRVFVRRRLYDSRRRLCMFLLFQSFVGTAVSLTIYGILFDPRQVYKTELPIGLGIGVVVLTLQLTNALPLLIVLFVHKVARRVEYPSAWLSQNDADPMLWQQLQALPSKKN